MRIISKKSLGKKKVCDVVGSKTENFVIGETSKGIVVHNSALG